MWCIVRLISEFSNNSQRRISFPLNSADGLFLFRYTAQILIHFGDFMNSYHVCMIATRRTRQYPYSSHKWQMAEVEEKYKSLSLYLKCLHSALTGGYANFGVFQLYSGIFDLFLRNLIQRSNPGKPVISELWVYFFVEHNGNRSRITPILMTKNSNTQS